MQIRDRLLSCERENARLRTAVRGQWLLMVFGGVMAAGGVLADAPRTGSVATTIEAREIVIRDAKGVVRARIAGDLPDAVIDGKPAPRGQGAAGFMVYDRDGQERGGYVTFDDGNVALTLDSKRRQQALFVVGPEGAAAAELWSDESLLGMRVDEAGPRFTANRQGKVVYQVPSAVAISDAVCAEYRNPEVQASHAQRLEACQQRFVETECRRCLAH